MQGAFEDKAQIWIEAPHDAAVDLRTVAEAALYQIHFPKDLLPDAAGDLQFTISPLAYTAGFIGQGENDLAIGHIGAVI